MAEGVRDRMVRSAVIQLAKRGVDGASFAEILAHAKAPRGSVYHHFPAGKQELMTAALDYLGSDALAALDELAGASVDDIIDAFVAGWRRVLERSNFTVGCAILAVTVTAEDHRLLDRAAQVFRSWQERLAELLRLAGLAEPAAHHLATMMIAATEGAVVLARAERSLEPLATVHSLLKAIA